MVRGSPVKHPMSIFSEFWLEFDTGLASITLSVNTVKQKNYKSVVRLPENERLRGVGVGVAGRTGASDAFGRGYGRTRERWRRARQC